MDDDHALIERLRAGDEAAFVEVVGRYQPRLLRVAQATVGSRAVAEEVCQDTWLAVVRGVDRFEERASFRTWLFHVLLNRARSSATSEQRAGRADEDAVERFDADGEWAEPPVPWSERVDDRLVAEHLARRIRDLLPTLPEHQRQVVVLRDIEGIDAGEVSAILGITEGNVRVLLHRARARLRHDLSLELGDER